MKPFEISESRLSLSEVSMREEGQRRLQARKKVADHWQRIDSTTLTAGVRQMQTEKEW